VEVIKFDLLPRSNNFPEKTGLKSVGAFSFLNTIYLLQGAVRLESDPAFDPYLRFGGSCTRAFRRCRMWKWWKSDHCPDRWELFARKPQRHICVRDPR